MGQARKGQTRMRGSPVWRSQLFRAAIFYTALFSFSTMLMFAYAWWTTSRLIEKEVAQVVEAELRGLAEEYRAAGTVGLIGAINRRISADADPEGIYLLVEPDGMRLTGNLASWPVNLPLDGTWISFRLLSADGRNSMIIGARAFILEGGLQLLVGRNLAARTNLQNSLLQALAIGLSASLVLGACGGIYSSRRLLKRVSAIGAVSQQILEGDLTRRLPRDSSGDEFDRLAEQLNRMLERLETLVSELRLVTDSLAHDLRAPLTRLRSRLEESLSHPGGEREAIEGAIEEADHLLVTFRALLDIARAEAGALGDELKPLDMALLLQETAELFEPVAEDQGVTLTCETQTLPPLRGHRQLLAQAIANLIENALKFSSDGGRIALSLQAKEGEAVITVADNGPGIAPKDRERVLQRFVRLDTSRTSPGSGLGLSLVAAVAHLHESRLEMADNAPGLKVIWRFPLRAN